METSSGNFTVRIYKSLNTRFKTGFKTKKDLELFKKFSNLFLNTRIVDNAQKISHLNKSDKRGLLINKIMAKGVRENNIVHSKLISKYASVNDIGTNSYSIFGH